MKYLEEYTANDIARVEQARRAIAQETATEDDIKINDEFNLAKEISNHETKRIKDILSDSNSKYIKENLQALEESKSKFMSLVNKALGGEQNA